MKHNIYFNKKIYLYVLITLSIIEIILIYIVINKLLSKDFIYPYDLKCLEYVFLKLLT